MQAKFCLPTDPRNSSTAGKIYPCGITPYISILDRETNRLHVSQFLNVAIGNNAPYYKGFSINTLHFFICIQLNKINFSNHVRQHFLYLNTSVCNIPVTHLLNLYKAVDYYLYRFISPPNCQMKSRIYNNIFRLQYT